MKHVYGFMCILAIIAFPPLMFLPLIIIAIIYGSIITQKVAENFIIKTVNNQRTTVKPVK